MDWNLNAWRITCLMNTSHPFLLVYFIAFWPLLNFLKHRLHHKSNSSLLPAPISSVPHQDEDVLYSTPSTHITLSSKIHLRLETTEFNVAHERLAFRLNSREYLRWKTTLGAFYDVGSVMGVLGMMGAVLLLLVTCVSLLWTIYVRHSGLNEHGSNVQLGTNEYGAMNEPGMHHFKRDLSAPTPRSGPFIQPIVRSLSSYSPPTSD